MIHANAVLTAAGRRRLARCVVEDGWPLRRAAQRFQVAVTTAKRWAERYRLFAPAGMLERSSRPPHSPRRTPTRTERRIIKVRLARRWGPARIAGLLGLNPATVHRVLVRYRLARLAHLDRATGRVVRRHERATPAELVHVDINKLGNIPHAGGHRVVGRQGGQRHRGATPGKKLDSHRRSHLGHSYPHNAIDDHSRLAYTEILPDQTTHSAVAF